MGRRPAGKRPRCDPQAEIVLHNRVADSDVADGGIIYWQVYITVMKLLVEYMTGHFIDLAEAVDDFLQALPGSPCTPADRPARLQWPVLNKDVLNKDALNKDALNKDVLNKDAAVAV